MWAMTNPNTFASARNVNRKGMTAPKMGLVTINGRVCLVPQDGEKVRVSLSKVTKFLGIPETACLRIG